MIRTVEKLILNEKLEAVPEWRSAEGRGRDHRGQVERRGQDHRWQVEGRIIVGRSSVEGGITEGRSSVGDGIIEGRSSIESRITEGRSSVEVLITEGRSSVSYLSPGLVFLATSPKLSLQLSKCYLQRQRSRLNSSFLGNSTGYCRGLSYVSGFCCSYNDWGTFVA